MLRSYRIILPVLSTIALLAFPAWSQQTALVTPPNYLPRYQYTHLQEQLAKRPDLQERAKAAQASGVNDTACNTAHQGDLYKYEINTGTDPNGYYYNPLCPKGSIVYLWYPPSEGPKYYLPPPTAAVDLSQLPHGVVLGSALTGCSPRFVRFAPVPGSCDKKKKQPSECTIMLNDVFRYGSYSTREYSCGSPEVQKERPDVYNWYLAWKAQKHAQANQQLSQE